MPDPGMAWVADQADPLNTKAWPVKSMAMQIVVGHDTEWSKD